MSHATTVSRQLRFVFHDSFQQPDAELLYGSVEAPAVQGTFLCDEVTRALARCMHYAAWRQSQAQTDKERQHWEKQFYAWRNRIVVGNHRLIYRAISRWMPPARLADDLAGDCQIVLIQAVAAYNPWLGIRFSTYLFTCLMRALSRLSQRHVKDRLACSLPLESLPDGGPCDLEAEEMPGVHLQRLEEFLQEKHQLLTGREKQVLIRRFNLDRPLRGGTLAEVGRELGLSKERVRQVQTAALDKLRKALAPERE